MTNQTDRQWTGPQRLAAIIVATLVIIFAVLVIAELYLKGL